MGLMRFMCLQSQARSFTKDAGDAPGEAHVATNTERLRNQFNFNDRTTQVGALHCVALPHHKCPGDRCHCRSDEGRNHSDQHDQNDLLLRLPADQIQ